MSTPRAMMPSSARRSQSAGSSRASSVGPEWSSRCLVRAPPHEVDTPPPSPSRVEPCDVPLVSVTELGLLDDITVGCCSGSVRLEGVTMATGASGASSRITSPTSRRPEIGAKFNSTPFALRDPVLVRFANGRLMITKADADRKEICACPLASVAKIVQTVTGVTIVADSCFTAELSIHEEAKATLLVKLLHAKTRGAPPPKEIRPVTRPLRTKSRVCGAPVSAGSRSASMEPPEAARKGSRETLSTARDRSSMRNGEVPTRHELMGSAGEQAEADRDRRRQQLYRQLSQLKRGGSSSAASSARRAH